MLHFMLGYSTQMKKRTSPWALTIKPMCTLIRGQLQVNGQLLKAGDALLLEGEHRIDVSGGLDAEVLVFVLFEN
jgi:hypothetical protein